MKTIVELRAAPETAYLEGNAFQAALLANASPATLVLLEPLITASPAANGSHVANAAETISASKVVRITAAGLFELAEPDGIPAFGVALNSASPGQAVAARAFGYLEDTGAPWTPGVQYLAAGGTLTATPPGSGWHVRIGYAPATTRLEINIEQPMELT